MPVYAKLSSSYPYSPKCPENESSKTRLKEAGNVEKGHDLTRPRPQLPYGNLALLLGKALVLGLLLRRALGFLGYLLDPLLRVLGLLLGLLHEGVAGLAHHLVLLSGLGDRQAYGRPDPDA